MSVTKHTLPPNPSRLIEGLRDTGYDFNTALADIIDNSVDAEAQNIDIRIVMDPEGDVLISVADNGRGMNEEELLNGMTYGAEGNYEPKRLGKFGMGLKTASTAFCRRLSVISRSSADDRLLKAIWDLDHVVNAAEWELLLEDPSQLEKELFEKTAADRPGTLVIWDKIDRVLKNYANPGSVAARKALEKIISEFKQHVAMVYQRFLDNEDERARNIKITINGEVVEPWDPFCENETATELVASEKVPVEIEGSSPAEFTIRAFILPRREQFSSADAARDARLTNNMQGIYIYRENRLIHSASWLGMFSKEPHLTLLRVEFSFNHLLDDAFQMDIKKSRIMLIEELYTWVLNQFLPAPRNAANQRYRKTQRQKISDQAKNVHGDSNKSIGAREEALRMADIKVSDTGEDEADVTNRRGQVKVKLKIGSSTDNGQIFVQTVENINDGMLWEPALIDGHHSVHINTGHPYYQKVYVPNHSSGVTVQGIDSLLWALVEAELGTISEATKNHFSDLRYEVSRLLRKLVEDLPEPEQDEEGNYA